MFDKVKFSLLIGFHITFKIGTKKKGMSTLELSKEFDLREKTCWSFKRKLQDVMKSSFQNPLTGVVHVDEFWIGGPDEDKRGCSVGSEKMIVVALEIVVVANVVVPVTTKVLVVVASVTVNASMNEVKAWKYSANRLVEEA